MLINDRRKFLHKQSTVNTQHLECHPERTFSSQQHRACNHRNREKITEFTSNRLCNERKKNLMNYKGSMQAREGRGRTRSREGDWQSIQPELKRLAVVGTAVPIRPGGFLAPLNPWCAEEGPGKSWRKKKELRDADGGYEPEEKEEEDEEGGGGGGGGGGRGG